uniref:Uncharacterized protein n=1 Tax=Anopheles atroparvus TaxID=41427 RepID=A0AAG5DPB2_ANOAO
MFAISRAFASHSVATALIPVRKSEIAVMDISSNEKFDDRVLGEIVAKKNPDALCVAPGPSKPKQQKVTLSGFTILPSLSVTPL